MSLILLGIFATLPTVMAYPPFAAETPNSYITVEGQYNYGTLNSFKYYGDVIHWEALIYQIGSFWWIPIYAWKFKVDTFFDHPGPSYPIVRLIFKFKYQGASSLRIHINYYGSGAKTFYESSTGGAYVEKVYELDAYKAVWAIVIDTVDVIDPIGYKQYLWVDFLLAGYEDPFL